MKGYGSCKNRQPLTGKNNEVGLKKNKTKNKQERFAH